jgi:hypothetical protein
MPRLMTTPSTALALAGPRATPSSEWPDAEDQVALRGNLVVVSVLDVLQWLCISQKSWVLRLYRQEVEASVTVTAGQIVDARWGALTGEAALVETLGCLRGSFQLEPIEGELAPTLAGDWRSTLLRAVQALDERRPGVPDSCRQATRDNAASLKSPKRSGEHRVAAVAPETGFDFAERPLTGAPVLPDPTGHAEPQANDPTSLAELSASTDDLGDDDPSLPAQRNLAATYLTDLGFAALRDGNLAEARHHWTRALLCDPDNRTLRLNLRKLDEKSTVPR